MTSATQVSESPIDAIRARFVEKRAQNRHYSIAAYARDLGVSRSFLSRLLSGQRPMTLKLAVQIGTLFKLDKDQMDRWFTWVDGQTGKRGRMPLRVKEQLAKRMEAIDRKAIHFEEIERFKAMSQWYHTAIINLTYIKGFKPTSHWIAKRLGITRVEAEEAIERLIGLKMLVRQGDRLFSPRDLVFFNQKSSEASIRLFHQQMSLKARESLEDGSQATFDSQYFSGITLAFDRARMPEFKAMLQKFAREFMQSAESPRYTDVYHLNLQLFPLTQISNGESK